MCVWGGEGGAVRPLSGSVLVEGGSPVPWRDPPPPTPPSPRAISALTAERVINAGDAGKELRKIKKHVPTSPVRIVLI